MPQAIAMDMEELAAARDWIVKLRRRGRLQREHQTGGSVLMASLVADFRPTSTNGPFAYTFEVDTALNTVVNNVASLGAALDGIKTLVAAQGGIVDRVHIVVTTH
jgi:hypothetical protein